MHFGGWEHCPVIAIRRVFEAGHFRHRGGPAQNHVHFGVRPHCALLIGAVAVTYAPGAVLCLGVASRFLVADNNSLFAGEYNGKATILADVDKNFLSRTRPFRGPSGCHVSGACRHAGRRNGRRQGLPGRPERPIWPCRRMAMAGTGRIGKFCRPASPGMSLAHGQCRPAGSGNNVRAHGNRPILRQSFRAGSGNNNRQGWRQGRWCIMRTPRLVRHESESPDQWGFHRTGKVGRTIST